MPRFVIEQKDKNETDWKQVDGYDERSMANEEVKAWRHESGKLCRYRVRDAQSPVVVEGEWTDDHLPCVNLRMGEKHVSLWWTSYETVAALRYAGRCKQARQTVQPLLDMIQTITVLSADDVQDDPDKREHQYTNHGFIDEPFIKGDTTHEQTTDGSDRNEHASGGMEAQRRDEGQDEGDTVRYQWGDTSTILLSERDKAILIDAVLNLMTDISDEEVEKEKQVLMALDGKPLVLEALTHTLDLPFRKGDGQS